MVVTLEEMKTYLRIDFPDDDGLLQSILATAEKMCADILRTDSLEGDESQVAVMYAAAYLYEHREEADHHALTLTLRALLFGGRKEAF